MNDDQYLSTMSCGVRGVPAAYPEKYQGHRDQKTDIEVAWHLLGDRQIKGGRDHRPGQMTSSSTKLTQLLASRLAALVGHQRRLRHQ